ncbi:hypothetical protein [Palleronia sp. THAF1]|uniref:hypothetical protein n=1 Tax=Palleronia sp. THAF1 TaxID=2587842 RepID=UPI000F5262C3|nr:hypothetical protein [Palleronia sp. THAF1]
MAAATLATASSVAAIVVDRLRPEMSVAEQIIAVLGVSIVLYLAYSATESVLRRVYYRHVRGRWHYVTVAPSGGNQNYAVMDIGFTEEGTLKYEVQLHRNPAELKTHENAIGSAISEAMDYDPKRRELHILYDVDLKEDKDRRRGRLRMTRNLDGTMTGMWTSVRNEKEISRGEVFAARPAQFDAKSTRWLKLREIER